jgi:hypothetical protein
LDNWKNITHSQNSVMEKSLEGTFTFPWITWCPCILYILYLGGFWIMDHF